MRAFFLALVLSMVMTYSFAESVAVSVVRVTREQVRNIFDLKEFQYADGSPVRMVVLPPEHYTSRDFLRDLGIPPHKFYSRADVAFSTGRLNLLRMVDDERELLPIVARTPGAIGYAQKHLAVHYRGRVYLVE